MAGAGQAVLSPADEPGADSMRPHPALPSPPASPSCAGNGYAEWRFQPDPEAGLLAWPSYTPL